VDLQKFEYSLQSNLFRFIEYISLGIAASMPEMYGLFHCQSKVVLVEFVELEIQEQSSELLTIDSQLFLHFSSPSETYPLQNKSAPTVLLH